MSATSLGTARAVADAVLYEGYLLYPYRSTARKNQVRWQFGVLGPPGAADSGVGEAPAMAMECPVVYDDPGARITVRLRFLQLQTRVVQRVDDSARGEPTFSPVEQLSVGDFSWLTWDEAVEHELVVESCPLSDLGEVRTVPVTVAGGRDVEPLNAADGSVSGRLVRSRSPLRAEVRLSSVRDGPARRLRIQVDNTAGAEGWVKDTAIQHSFIGTHLLLVAEQAQLVSVQEPPVELAALAAGCRQDRCWPVLAGPTGQSDVVLGAPIILYDHPEVAEQSAGALFDSTEIDEILTLRVMTMTEQEKAEARATDPRAAQIIDRCDAMTAQQLQQLHGVLRDPHAGDEVGPRVGPGGDDPAADLAGSYGFDGEVPWWDPAVDGAVRPDTDAVVVDGVPVSAGSRVRIHPRRRADAQDLFFADQEARVTAVHSDVDGNTHVAVVLVDDPAADLHDWYGRYLYFAPEEVEPLPPDPDSDRKEDP